MGSGKVGMRNVLLDRVLTKIGLLEKMYLADAHHSNVAPYQI